VEKNLGIEEPSIVKFLIKELNKRPKPETYLKKIAEIFGKADAKKFVEDLWKRIIFESKKIEEGIVAY